VRLVILSVIVCVHRSVCLSVYKPKLLSPPSVNIVNIGGDYEIGHSLRHCMCPSFPVCVCVHVFEAPYLHNGAR